MKRKLGRFFARVSGVLRRVWRWFLPTALRTDVQLAPPRPDEPKPTVTREVIDLEFEEIRAALAAEPSVNAAAPEAPRRPEPRPIDLLRFGEPAVAGGDVEPTRVDVAPAPPAEAPAYKAPKYGREPKAKVKLAAPRPTPMPPRAEEKVAPVPTPEQLEDTAVADLIARVDMFMNMGELPVAPPESVMAVEPELLVEAPEVRQRIVEQLLAEEMGGEGRAPSAEGRLPIAESRSPMAEDRLPIAEGRSPMAEDQSPMAEAPLMESVEPAPEALAAEGFALPDVADVLPEEELVAIALPDTATVAREVESSVEAVLAADAALSAEDEPPVVTEETPATDAPNEASVVAEAAAAVAEAVHVEAVEAVAGEAVTAAADVVVEPVALASLLAESVEEAQPAEEPVLEVAAVEEAQAVEEPVATPALAEDDAIDAELDAAMAQAEDANTAFANSHPEAVEEMAGATPALDDDERVEDEPWSPPPVMADAYYEYAMEGEGAVAEELLADEAIADSRLPMAEDRLADEAIADCRLPMAEDRLADEAIADSGLPIAEDRLADDGGADANSVSPEVAAMAVEEPLPPEVAAMHAAVPAPLDGEATFDAVAAAVEETLAAAQTLEAVTETVAEMPADADALAAAAMADVVATAIAAEEEPPAPTPAFRNPIPKIETPTDYVATPESMHALYQLQLDGFEGPLDLLLHLIKRHHLDIFDIPIAFICERYLEYLKAMEDVDIDVASEFLFMAAELLQLKSRMLLPRPEGEAAEEEEIDPRAELVRRLLEYQKYKDVAERFGILDRFGRDTFGRDAEPTPPPEGEAPLKEVGLFALVKAFQACLDRQKPEVRHQVMLEQVSVRQRIRTLVQRFESQEPTRFDVLLEDAKRRIDIVVTFLALLEMGKLKLLRIFQSEDGVIYVHPKFDDVSLAFARLEGLDESQYAG